MAEVTVKVTQNIPDNRDTDSEIVEVVPIRSDRDVRKIVQHAFSHAKKTLARSRRRKIRHNLACVADQHSSLQASHNSLNSSLHAAASALKALPKRVNVPICMKAVREIPPNGRAWIRVQTNMMLPSAYLHSFHVPYLGESDAHLQSSNNLAMDLLQQEHADDGEQSEIEDYVDFSLVQVDGDNDDDDDDKEFDDDEDNDDTPQSGLAKRDGARRRNSLKRKRKSPSSRKLKRRTLKLTEAVWDRAAKRVALKSVMDKLGSTNVEAIADAVSDVFGFWNRKFVTAYYRIISNRLIAIAEVDKDACERKDGLDLVMKQASGQVVDSPAEVMRSESVKVFICRQCYSFLCILHGQMNQPRPIVPPVDGSRKELVKGTGADSIEASCEDRGAETCWYTDDDGDDVKRWSDSLKGRADSWRDVEPVLRELFEAFGRDACRISSLLRTALPALHSTIQFTCRRVGYLLQQLFPEGNRGTGNMKQMPILLRRKKGRWKTQRPPQEQESRIHGRRLDYEPCHHEGSCTTKNCVCKQKGVLCEKFCGCFSPTLQEGKTQVWCLNMHKGCTCKGTCQSKACVCFSMNRECDPDICRSCHECKEDSCIDDKKWSCQNNGLRMKRRQKIVAGHSDVHGWGVFATERIVKNDIIGEYVGEVISDDEAERRGRVYDEVTYSFLFTTTEQYALDSTHLGNKLRYCNHSRNPNCEPRVMRVGGDVRVGLYAKRDIEKNEELFFNYGYNENGPAWAMVDKAVKSRLRGSLSGKRAPSSDDDNNELAVEVLPVSTRRRKTLETESKAQTKPVLTALTPIPDVLEEDIGRATTVDIDSPQLVVPPQSKRRRQDEPGSSGKNDVEGTGEQSKYQKKMNSEAKGDQPSQSNSRSPGSGPSVWRGILRRVSVAVAEADSPREGCNLVNGQNQTDCVAEGKRAVRRSPARTEDFNNSHNNNDRRGFAEDEMRVFEQVSRENGSGSTVTARITNLPNGTVDEGDQMISERDNSQVGSGGGRHDRKQGLEVMGNGIANTRIRKAVTQNANKTQSSCREISRVLRTPSDESDTDSNEPQSMPKRFGTNGSKVQRALYKNGGICKSGAVSKRHRGNEDKSTGVSEQRAGNIKGLKESRIARDATTSWTNSSYSKIVSQSPVQSCQDDGAQAKRPQVGLYSPGDIKRPFSHLQPLHAADEVERRGISRQVGKTETEEERQKGTRKRRHNAESTDNMQRDDSHNSRKRRSSLGERARQMSKVCTEQMIDLVSVDGEGSARGSYEPNFDDWF